MTMMMMTVMMKMLMVRLGQVDVDQRVSDKQTLMLVVVVVVVCRRRVLLTVRAHVPPSGRERLA